MKDQRFYCEVKSPLGNWMTQIWDHDPATRLNRSKRIRFNRRIMKGHENLTCDQARNVYSPVGKFYHV